VAGRRDLHFVPGAGGEVELERGGTPEDPINGYGGAGRNGGDRETAVLGHELKAPEVDGLAGDDLEAPGHGFETWAVYLDDPLAGLHPVVEGGRPEDGSLQGHGCAGGRGGHSDRRPVRHQLNCQVARWVARFENDGGEVGQVEWGSDFHGVFTGPELDVMSRGGAERGFVDGDFRTVHGMRGDGE